MITWINKIIITRITSRIQRSYFPFFILGIGLFFTVLLTYSLSHQMMEKDQIRFDAQNSHVVNTIENTMDTYVTLLRAGSGLMMAKETVSEDEFKTFVNKLELRERYPGVQGIGYSIQVQDSSEISGIFPIGDREEYHKIIFLEPLDSRNQEAVGFDMYSEPVRREAMQRARDSGHAIMTGKVTLLQENEQSKQSGFLIYVPVYEGARIPDTVEERRNEFRGFVYSPFRADDLLNSFFQQYENRLIEFAIYDGESLDDANRIFSTASMPKEFDSLEWFWKSTKISISGHDWTLVSVPSQTFIRTSERYIVPLTFFSGLALSFTLFILNFYQLRSQENKIDILEGITDGFISVNRKWKVTYVNKRGASIFQKEPEEFMHRNLWKQIPSEMTGRYVLECKKAMHERKVKRSEVHFPKHDEWYSIRIYPSHNGLSLFFQDITESKKLEERKDEFISIASHELKTPLTSIRGFAQLAATKLRKRDLEAIPGYMERIVAYIDRLNVMISELLDVSKIKSHKLELHLEQFTLKSLIYDAKESIEHILANHVVSIKGPLQLRVIGDKDRLEQVLTNLLSNAVKYSPFGSTINISIKKQNRAYKISVQDHGIGIKKSDQKKIFDRYYRSNAGPEITGMGIGLYVSSEIVRYHGGTLSVKSALGKGSVFSFTIPLRARQKKTKKKKLH